METISKKMVNKTTRSIKVIQFGEGNFLRGFVDYMLDIANEKGLFDGDIAIVKAIEFGNLDLFRQQDNCYTVSLRGLVKGKKQVLNRIVTNIAEAVSAYEEYEEYAELAKLSTLRFVVSNTTEAGIVYDDTDRMELKPPKSYPGKLTKFLYERYSHFKGDLTKGLIILPVELIDDNGIYLKEDVLKLSGLWQLEDEFITWLNQACVFCSTLVDRITPGFPRDEAADMWEELGYKDNLIVTAEPFALWVIESDRDISYELPLDKAGLPVIFTDNQKPYKQRKVRILNGAHTSFALASFLAGNDYVKESMQDAELGEFVNHTVYEEIIPTLDLPRDDLLSFADAVKDRFENPFIKHSLLSISLNSVSKWKARCMPSFLEYIERFSKLPRHLTFSLAALMEFYQGIEIRGNALIGHRLGMEYEILDDIEVLEFFAEYSSKETQQYVTKFLSKIAFWDQDLTQIPNLTETMIKYITDINNKGMRDTIKNLNQQ
ncbi:MAG: tagaturonate reductase [Mobilitalea sp.]